MAQKTLQSTFGFELVELMSRADLNREQNANEEVKGGANATGLRKKSMDCKSRFTSIRIDGNLISDRIRVQILHTTIDFGTRTDPSG